MPLNKSQRPRRVPNRRSKSSDTNADLRILVKEGVEEFILRHATIDEFWKWMHSASRQEKEYSHQLTSSVLTKIVRLAVQQRNKERATRHKALKKIRRDGGKRKK